MLDIADELHRWVEQGRDFAVATVVAVGGSAPRRPGAALAVDTDGTAIGSVSGGCVEGAVYDLCRQALQDGESGPGTLRLQRRGRLRRRSDLRRHHRHPGHPGAGRRPRTGRCSRPRWPPPRRGEAARSRGSSAAPPNCGARRAASSAPTARTRAASAPIPSWTARSSAEAGALLDAGRTGTLEIGEQGSRCGAPLTVLVESRVPPPRMIVFGAIDFASALVRIGQVPRLPRHGVRRPPRLRDRESASPRPTRSSSSGRTGTWSARRSTPGRSCASSPTTPSSTYRCCELALRLPVAYVGAMGSRRTHLDRNDRLREVGVTELELARLRSPIGLDLGARTPEETALSIAAEIVAEPARRQRASRSPGRTRRSITTRRRRRHGGSGRWPEPGRGSVGERGG